MSNADKTKPASTTELRVFDVPAGMFIEEACRRLVEIAPGFMVFNGVRVEALPTDEPAKLADRWREDMAKDSPPKHDITDLQNRVAFLEGALSALRDRLEAHEARIARLERSVSR